MTTKPTAEWLLRSHQLRSTPVRVAVLAAFQQSDKAVSLKTLQTALPEVERTTLYRTLQTYLDCGLIHKALENIHGIHYALCANHCGHNHLESDHTHNHLHFQCKHCGQVECLELQVPLRLAQGTKLHIDEFELTARGTCTSCQAIGDRPL